MQTKVAVTFADLAVGPHVTPRAGAGVVVRAVVVARAPVQTRAVLQAVATL